MRPTIAVLAAGCKGFAFAEDLAVQFPISALATYPHPAQGEPSVTAFEELAGSISAPLVTSRRPSSTDLGNPDLIFAVGWQYVLEPPPDGLVVLHDSLLPRYRGFAPTVSALIEGERRLGVSAIVPSQNPDQGRVLTQSAIDIEYPLNIRQAFALLRPAYISCAKALVENWNGRLPDGEEQDESSATYSMWRDDDDFLIDWSWDAERIVRFVDAVGPPYAGASTYLDGDLVRIGRARAITDVTFVDRHPGKVWRHGSGWADVVCNTGMVRVESIRNDRGEPVEVKHLRTRFRDRPLC